MVDFPVPARPLSQKMCWSCSPLNHSIISLRTPFLVPSRHPCLFPQRCPAFLVWCNPSRRALSYLLVSPGRQGGGDTHSKQVTVIADVLLAVIDTLLLVKDILLLVEDILLLAIYALLQRSLAHGLDVVGAKGLVHILDNP